jgi:hypothetical protein
MCLVAPENLTFKWSRVDTIAHCHMVQGFHLLCMYHSGIHVWIGPQHWEKEVVSLQRDPTPGSLSELMGGAQPGTGMF